MQEGSERKGEQRDDRGEWHGNRGCPQDMCLFTCLQACEESCLSTHCLHTGLPTCLHTGLHTSTYTHLPTHMSTCTYAPQQACEHAYLYSGPGTRLHKACTRIHTPAGLAARVTGALDLTAAVGAMVAGVEGANVAGVRAGGAGGAAAPHICRACAEHALGMRWACAGHVLDMCWACAGHVLGMCWACAGHMLESVSHARHAFCLPIAWLLRACQGELANLALPIPFL